MTALTVVLSGLSAEGLLASAGLPVIPMIRLVDVAEGSLNSPWASM